MKEYLFKKAADIIFAKIGERIQKSDQKIRVSTDDLEAALDHHLKDVKNWSAEISFADSHGPKRLDRVFISLDVFLQPRRLRMSPNSETTRIPLDAAITNTSVRHLIILGQSGAGKTTSMKHLCARILQDDIFLADVIDFPLVIRLRELNPQIAELESSADENVLIKKIQEILNIRIEHPPALSSELPPESNPLKRQLRNRIIADCIDTLKVLLIIDGFDEVVSQKVRERILSDIRTLAHQLESSRMILTCRTGEFYYHIDDTKQFEISPLSTRQVLDFALRWLGVNEGREFVSQLNQSPFADTALRPLNLAHLCAIYERVGKVPDKPKTLYRKIVNLLLEEWDQQRSVRRKSVYANFEIDRKFEFLAYLAYELTVWKQRSIFSKQDLEEVYDRIHDALGLPSGEATNVANELETHTGLFVQSGYEYFEFSHKSLQEYLAAEFLVRLPQIPWDAAILRNLPNELAIATAISSHPTYFLQQLVNGRFRTLLTSLDFLKTFITRLVIEKPDLQNTYTAAITLLDLSSQYLERCSQDSEIRNRPELVDELRSLQLLVRLTVPIEILLEFYGITEEASVSGDKFLRLYRREAGASPHSTHDTLRTALLQEFALPTKLWIWLPRSTAIT